MSKERAKVITFGRGGNTIYWSANSTTTGFSCDPCDLFKPYKWWADKTNSDHFHVEPGSAEGCVIVDMRAAVETEEGFKWAIRGPMVNPDLEDGAVDECPEPSALFAGAVASNQFGTLLALQKCARGTKSRGLLDSVSSAEYARGWKEHGARIGVIRNNQIVWEA